MNLAEALADYSGEYDAEYYDFNDHAEAAHLLRKRVRELENRANLIAGLGKSDRCLSGYQRAAVFILTGAWPAP